MSMSVMQILSQPSPKARVGTRWWWYGCAVTKEEIRRQMTEMQKANLGAVEIQIIYPTDMDQPEAGQKHIDYFSPEFFEMLDEVLRCGEELGIDVDFTLGSGWPYGGSFIEDHMAPAILWPLQHDVKGPCRFSFDYTCVAPGDIQKVVMVKMTDGVMDARTAVDITEKVKPTYIYTWQWGNCLEEIEIPEGDYKIYTFVVQKYKQNIGKPAPNMQGLAMDHCRKEVADFFFHTIGDTLVERLGRNRFRSFFCDSIELGGNNWCVTLPQEFIKRRGYDLSPYMPALWGDMGDVTPRIRHDFFQTFSEMTLEGFFFNFTDWCRKWGVTSRTQAHGIWADILKAYASADIPEGETFGEHDCYFVNTIHRRLAVSAGMVYGRPVVSNESFTWLRMPRFQVTPEMIKRAGDAILADGVNAIFNHGFSYSPQRVGKPGWNFYASSMINMNNTWWEYYPEVSRYLHRISALMQAGPIVSDVAVFIPRDDIWSRSTLAELHMALRIEDAVGRETVNHLQRAGYWFTYVNDEALTSLSSMENGGMRLGENLYRAIILPGVEWMETETAKALLEFERAGGTIIALNRIPGDVPGMKDCENRRKALEEIWGQLHVEMVSDRMEGLVSALNKVTAPDLAVEGEAAQDVGFIHRRMEGTDVYFIANMAAKARQVVLTLPEHQNAVLLDAMTLKAWPMEESAQNGRLRLSFAAEENQSFVLTFGESAERASVKNWRKKALVEGWRLTVNGEEIFSGRKEPLCWNEIDQTKYFCGEGTYSAAFWVQDENKALRLKLESLDCCAEVFVNGESCGKLWKAPWTLELKNIRPGENLLEIRVVNTWINHFIDPDLSEPFAASPTADTWPYFTNIIDDVRRRRLYSTREKKMIRQPQRAGLCGKVWLEE